ncbi:MAG TPA: 4Fe-4S dicluster domain-containing protein [Methanomassiliicoccales archaeon]|nr:4Fe-4S dicluster domain-containing protein [Methanomassiliicoccales archaeon]
MNNHILKKEGIADAIKALGKDHAVYVPVENKRGLIEFKELGKGVSVGKMKLDRKPDTPPKAVLFPQTELLLTYKKVGGKYAVTPAPLDEREKIIFGARPCDAIAITLMDKVFCGGKFVDWYYKNRRDRVTLFTIACDGPADEYCFCPSTGGSPASRDGSDVMLYDVGDSYYAEGLTDRGVKALELLKNHLGKPTSKQEQRKDEIVRSAEAGEGFTRKIPAESIAKLDTSFDSKYWEDVARRCLSCGACTYYCPTCHCFDINDEQGGKRVRTWDSCQFGIFTVHTSGHNPRMQRGQKLRNRYYHKFKYSKENIGRFLCVGCGRCVALCPASLDITKVISEVK